MLRPKTLYEVLGIPRDADDAVVRAAYRVLMKRHHPDRAAGSQADVDGVEADPSDMVIGDVPAGMSDNRAAELNAAFAVLRDPGRRARYDAELRFHDARGTTAPVAVASPNPVPPRASPLSSGPGQSSRSGLYAFVALALVVLTAVWAGMLVNGKSQRASVAASQAERRAPDGAPTAAAELGPSPVPIDTALAAAGRAEFARIFATRGLSGAATYSQLCFAEQARTRRADDLDYCIAFDRAAYLRTSASGAAGSSGLPTLTQFDADVIAQRHAAAASLVSGERVTAIALREDMVGVDALRGGESGHAGIEEELAPPVPSTPTPPPPAVVSRAPPPSVRGAFPAASRPAATRRARAVPPRVRTTTRAPTPTRPQPRRSATRAVQPDAAARQAVPATPRNRPVRRQAAGTSSERATDEAPRRFTIGPQ